MIDDPRIQTILASHTRIRRMSLLLSLGKDLRPRMQKSKARNIICLCPFHNEKSPSFRMKLNGDFRCFGCDKMGTWIDLIVAIHEPENSDQLLCIAQKFLRFQKDASRRSLQIEFEF